MTTFAHITDIHLSERTESWKLAEPLIKTALARFNAMDDLDFVAVTGDILDVASQVELDHFLTMMETLNKPWYFVPGNHDGYFDPNVPQAFAPHEAVEQINHPPLERRPDAQHAYWSVEIGDNVRLIGIDSRYADHWNGKVEAHQREWLHHQLNAYGDHTIIVMIHHPIIPLYPINAESPFDNFIIDDGDSLAAELSAVKVVVHGHHHANRLIEMDGWLHIGTAPLTEYPFSYRLITVEGNHVTVDTHTIADEATLTAGREAAHHSTVAGWYNPDNPTAWVDLSLGSDDDLHFEGTV